MVNRWGKNNQTSFVRSAARKHHNIGGGRCDAYRRETKKNRVVADLEPVSGTSVNKISSYK